MGPSMVAWTGQSAMMRLLESGAGGFSLRGMAGRVNTLVAWCGLEAGMRAMPYLVLERR
jgi:hypothetical protein